MPGRPLVYGTTDRFLRCFSLNSLDDLPDLPKTDEVDSISKDGSQTSLFDADNSAEKILKPNEDSDDNGEED